MKLSIILCNVGRSDMAAGFWMQPWRYGLEDLRVEEMLIRFNLAQYKDNWRSLINTAMKFHIP